MSPANRVRIPERIGKTEITKQEQDMLRAGLPVRDKLIERNDGRKFVTTLQVNVEQRGVEFVPGTGKSPRTAQTIEEKNNPKQMQGQAQGAGNTSSTQKEQRRNTWTNADGSIRPISKWSGVDFTDQQKSRLCGRQSGEIRERNRQTRLPRHDVHQVQPGERTPRTVTTPIPTTRRRSPPANESRTQVAVNNEGKTNEATKNVKEPLQKGQTAPKDDKQQQRQEKPQKKKQQGHEDVTSRARH